MSVVVSIKRVDPPLLSQGEMDSVLDNDGDFIRVGDATWRWKCAAQEHKLFINRDENELWTDGSRSWLSEGALQKLRAIAEALNARVLCEEGGDITQCEQDSVNATSSPLAVTVSLLATAILLPLLLIFAVLRMPWILWRITRNK